MLFRSAVLDARRAGDWLLKQGYRRLALLGTSLGSCVAFLTLAHDQRFRSGVFIHGSAYFADICWHGLSTQHVGESLKGSIELDELRQLWLPISPYPFVERLRDTGQHLQIFAGRYDPTFLPHLSQQLFDKIERCRVPHEINWLRCGHYTIGRLPFSAVVVQRTLRFLRRERDRT